MEELQVPSYAEWLLPLKKGSEAHGMDTRTTQTI